MNIYWHPWSGPVYSTFGCLEVSFADISFIVLRMSWKEPAHLRATTLKEKKYLLASMCTLSSAAWDDLGLQQQGLEDCEMGVWQIADRARLSETDTDHPVTLRTYIPCSAMIILFADDFSDLQHKFRGSIPCANHRQGSSSINSISSRWLMGMRSKII